MHKTTIYLPDDLRMALRRMARIRRRSEADLVREAIANLTKCTEAPEPRLPLFRASGPPIAERVDEELAEGFGE